MATRNTVNKTYVTQPDIINTPGGGNTTVQYNKNGTFAGDNGLRYNESLKELSVQGNINVGGWVKGKIYTNTFNFFLSGGNDGQVLTTDGTGNLSWTDQTGGGGSGNYSNSNVSAYLSTFTGNISAGNIKTNNLLYANGVAWNFAGTYSNSNVANYLPTYTGNVSAGNIRTNNLLYANGVAWNFAGTYSNANVDAYLPTYTGNVSAGNIRTNNLLYANGVAWNFASSYSNANVANYLPTYTGNISASFFTGNGSQLTGINTSRIANGNSNVNVTSVNGNIVVTANSGTAKAWNFSTNGLLTFPDGATTTGGNITTSPASNLKLTTTSLETRTAPCYIGLPTEYVADTENNNSITAVQVGWTVTISGTTYTVTYIDPAPPANQYRITVNGTAGFVSGTSYTFTNPVPIQKPWVFGIDGNLTLPTNTSSINYANGQPYGGGGSGNTGDVTFSHQIVIGTGDEFGSGGLYLAPGNAEIGNLQYLRVRGGDQPSHIHFDTGNNQFYDQYFGDDNKYLKLEAGTSGNIVIGTDNNGKNWTFGDSGNLSVPGSITSILSGGFPFGASITNITTGNPTVVVTIDGAVFPDPVTGRVTITGVQGATQANGTRYYQAVNEDQFQLFNDAACTIPTSGTDWSTYTTGGFAYSPEYNDLELKGDNVNIRTGDSIIQFKPNGDLQMPGGAYASGGYGRLLTNNGYTTLLSYGTDEEHGGPELDWSNANDPANTFGNSNVLRNTLYLNDTGLYVGLNENNNANAVTASLRFNRFGALQIPSGSANTMTKGQILSGNESGFINLDVQFDIEPGLEGGVRLGTTASKPVDIRAGSTEWRFDSTGSLTVPGVIKSIGSYQYRGFYAVLNQISGDDPSINQIVLSRSSDISGSNPTTDTDDDNFIVTGINGSNITAIVNLYGQSTSVPLDTESLFLFIRNYIDVVLYDGNTQRTSISDIRIAFEVNESELLGPENFTSGTIVDNMNFNCIQAIVPASDGTTTGSGTGAVFLFDCDPPATGSVDYNSIEWNYNNCPVPGTGYQVGDTITVPGTVLGGAAPADNMTITVDGINGSGGITSLSTTGTMSQASYAQCVVKHYIYDGASDIYDQGNFLGTDISRCVFTAYTDSNSNLVVTSVTSGGLYPWMTFYEPTNQTYPMVVWQTDGVDEGGTGTYVCGGYDTIGSNLPSRTYTAYGMYYGVGETISGGSGTAWGGGTYGSMVGREGNGIFSMVSLGGTASTVSFAGNTGSDSDGAKAAISPFPLGAEPQPLYLESSNNTWQFGIDGNLTVPGNINAAATESFPINTTVGDITTGGTNVYVTLNNISFPGPVTGKVAISGAVGTVQANGTWWFQAVEVSDIQLFTDPGLTTPANGTTWLAYQGGGTAVSVTYDNLVIGAGVLSLGNPNRKWTIFEDGNLVAEHSTATIVGASGLAIEVAAGNALTNVINVPVNQTYSTWNTATYSNNSGTGRIDIVGSNGSLRRFVQLYMQNANQGTAVLTINNLENKLTYNGFESIGNTFTIYVVQSPGDSVTVTTMTLDAVMRNAIELNDDNNQLNIVSHSGWPVNITSGWQGDVNINAGDDIYLNAGDKRTSDSTGGQIDINAGNGGDADTGDFSGNGGAINIRGGDGGVASNAYGGGNGGTTFITGGSGGFAHAGGLQNAGDGGSLVLNAGSAGSNDGNISLGRQGGNVEIQAGYATGSFVGGFVSITAGQGGTGYSSGNITLATQASDHTTNYAWNFDSTGNLTLPRRSANNDPILVIQGGENPSINSIHYSLEGPANLDISAHNTIFTGSNGNSVKIYPDDGEISSEANLQLWSNSGNINEYSWTLDTTGNLTLPTISTSESTDERSIIRSQRKIIPPLHYSVVVNDVTPTVAYTASNNQITSLKTTFSLLHVGLGREMFDVSALAAGADVMYSVSNRLNGTGQPDTTVSVGYDGSSRLAVTFTVNSGAFTTWVTYDSTEFGSQAD